MNSGQLPEWLRRKHAILADVEKEKQTQRLATMTVRAEGETFWRQVCDELKLVADNPPEPLQARCHHAPSATSRHEDHCRIEIGYSCASPRLSYTDLWYVPGDERIRYKPLGKLLCSLRLCVVDGKLCVIGDSLPMSAEAVAQFIAEPLIEYAMPAALASVS
jgi:hypothetical protein